MEESGRVIDIVVFCVAGFLIPIILFVFLRVCVEDTTLRVRLQSFAENVSTKGYVDYAMYESFVKELNGVGVLVAPEFHVDHELLAPEYKMRSLEDAEGYLDGLWSGSNVLNQGTVTTYRPTVTDPGVPPAGGLTGNVAGTDTSTTGPSVSHSHSSACYNGTQHVCNSSCYSSWSCSGRMTSYIGVSPSYSYCGIYRTHSGTYTVSETPSNSGTACSHCGKRYNMLQYSTWLSTYCSVCDAEVKRYHYADCPHCGERNISSNNWTEPCTKVSCSGCGASGGTNGEYHYTMQNVSYYKCNSCGSGSTSSYGAYCTNSSSYKSCGKTNGTYYNADGTECSVMCTQVVTSLTPIVKEQVIAMGAGVDARAKAVFADGHSEVVTCAVTGFNASTANVVQTVTLSYGTYSGSLSNKTATKCTVKVMIKYQTKTCSNGHIHYLTEGASTVCPFCKAYPKTLTVLGASEIPFHMRKGTTLRQNGISLKVTYMDGHTETITSGWTDNLDINYIGEQTVTIGYLGASTTLKVYNERVKVPCSVCGYEYSLYPDNTDPGCPKCLSAIPVFTGNVLRYKESVSYGEILDELYHGDGIYYFSRGDILKLQLWKTSKTPVNTILGKLFGRGAGEELVSMYSVKIRDEKVRK